VREFLASRQITVLEHPPYSPDLASNDFFLFPNIKEVLKEGIFMALMTSMKGIPENEFQNCFEGWSRYWHLCIAFLWEYYEGDHSDIQQ
jgi:hypothetical protein